MRVWLSNVFDCYRQGTVFSPTEHERVYAIFIAGSHFEVVYKAYCQEISLREKILGDMIQQSCRDTVTMYLSCWLHEPYIGAECTESLEALLIDTNLR